MIIEITTLSDFGAERLKHIIHSSLMARQSNAEMGAVRNRMTYSNFLEAKARMRIPIAPTSGVNLKRIREWIMDSIRMTYKSPTPGFIVMVEQLEDSADLDPPIQPDDPYMPEPFDAMYGMQQPGSTGTIELPLLDRGGSP